MNAPTKPLPITTPTPTHTPPCAFDFAAFVGLDWGDYKHAFALWAEGLSRPELGQIQHSAENFHSWLEQLCARFCGRRIAVALEASRGPIVAALKEHASITIFPINPVTSASFRKAFRPSGASDDVPDALVLLDLLRHHRERLSSHFELDEQTHELQLLCEARRKVVDRITLLTNQITSLLKAYYPQALHLFGHKLSAPIALDFLSRWPDLPTLQKSKDSVLQKFYYAHNVRRPETVAERLALVRSARALSTNAALVRTNRRALAVLVAEVRLLTTHLAGFDEAIDQLFTAHPEHHIFSSLPGAGAALAPRLCAAFGTRRERFCDAASVQRYVGVAPVTEKSGKSAWTHWRWNAPTFLRQSFVEWAGQSVRQCAWAKVFYLQRKQLGKDHSSILRALAFRWIRVIYRCWVERTAYDDARYVAALTKRGSHLPAMIAKLAPANP